jgi:hypothetical protein
MYIHILSLLVGEPDCMISFLGGSYDKGMKHVDTCKKTDTIFTSKSRNIVWINKRLLAFSQQESKSYRCKGLGVESRSLT